jgi:hypothetical protein
MISRARQLAPRAHLPLRQLALCLDWDECFEIGSPTCPACGSATWTSLSRFLTQASSARHPGRRGAAAERHDDPPETVLQLSIVAGVLYPWTGLLLSPIIASTAITFSSVSVIGNALRLRRVQL